jgi:hypothetical protein
LPEPVFKTSPRPEELAQGDVFESIEFFRPKGGTYKDTQWASGIILSHSCDFTKFRSDEQSDRANLDMFPMLVAPVVSISAIGDEGTAGHAKKGRVRRYFHLPVEAALSDEDHFVDFDFMQPVAVFELLAIARLASMSDEWQERLQIAIDQFFSRTESRP